MISINYTSTGSLQNTHQGSNTEVLCRQPALISGEMGVGSKVGKWESGIVHQKGKKENRESKSVYMSGISQEAFVV